MADFKQINLLGRKHAVIVPDYAASEELVVAYRSVVDRGGVALMRVYAAAIGLSTRLGKESGADYAASRFDVLAYGGAVYGWLRKQKVEIKEIAAIGVEIIQTVADSTFPSDVEVEEQMGKSEASAAS